MKKFLNFAVLGIIAGSLAVVSCTQEVKTSDFLKIGFPFTMTAVLCGYLFCWLVWA